ncbi:hypothetical protein SNE40_011236 [Patella caerulea]|uniref:Uncharacterized protein n=1 Tax=Patella caerulea TaxID=87958 RepID=A0AAN8JNP4_PATCE
MARSLLHYLCGTKEGYATCQTLCMGIMVIISLHGIIKFEQIREHGDFSSLNIPDDANFPPLGLSRLENFPTTGQDKVPKIIHQTWKSTEVPQIFIPWVKSWYKQNPDWEYWFWTDASARQLIEERYPSFIPIYDGYTEPIRRADAMRYFILYEFGGVYADLDIENIKSLNPIIKKYSCFFGQEPYVHSILDSSLEHLVINALIGCRKGHPFMKKLINNLADFSFMWNVLDSTGPQFVTYWFRQYQKQFNYPETHANGTYLSPPEYFFPTIDTTKFFWFRSVCGNYPVLNEKKKQACVHLKKTSVLPPNLDMSFTNHHWIHTYVFMFRLPLKGPVDIHYIVPKVKLYNSQD